MNGRDNKSKDVNDASIDRDMLIAVLELLTKAPAINGSNTVDGLSKADIITAIKNDPKRPTTSVNGVAIRNILKSNPAISSTGYGKNTRYVFNKEYEINLLINQIKRTETPPGCCNMMIKLENVYTEYAETIASVKTLLPTQSTKAILQNLPSVQQPSNKKNPDSEEKTSTQNFSVVKSSVAFRENDNKIPASSSKKRRIM